MRGVVVDEAGDRVLPARVRLRAAHQVLQRLRGEALGAVAPGGGAVALANLSSFNGWFQSEGSIFRDV